MAFTLPHLPYSKEALEPYIDSMTMEIHHDKHHGAYVTNLNKAIAGTEADTLNIEDILKQVSKYPAAVRNNAGGHYNHTLFWSLMRAPGKSSKPEGILSEALNAHFESFDGFKSKFAEAALARFGSGWAWLIRNDQGKLEIVTTPNQDNPLMDLAEKQGLPILGLDVWEHAYYLKYQNRRADYITEWWNVVNWDEVAARFVL